MCQNNSAMSVYTDANIYDLYVYMMLDNFYLNAKISDIGGRLECKRVYNVCGMHIVVFLCLFLSLLDWPS